MLDDKFNFRFNAKSESFSIPEVIELLNSQIVENNIGEMLVYFKDISGDFDFDFSLTNKAIDGDINLHKLSFKLTPFMDLPILLNKGKVSMDNDAIHLKDFSGYYNGKTSNKMDFSGSVKDYLKSVDTDLEGNAIVTNDLFKNYLSKMSGLPLEIKSPADTKIRLQTKNNKIDLKWLFWFKRGNGFIVDGEESVMNDKASRVLSAVLHFEDNLLNLKSLNYYAGNEGGDMKQIKIPILSAYGDFDLSNGQTYVNRIGLSIPKPLPSGFINVLIKQKLFKGGSLSGDIQVLNHKGLIPKVDADMKAIDVALPSQKLYIRNGHFKTNHHDMNLSVDGKCGKSDFSLSGTVLNEIKFPIIVKDINLTLDEVNVERYLEAFNAMSATEASNDVKSAISESVAKAEASDNQDVPTFDLANLIIEKCSLNVKKGFYKGINFANVVANLTMDKNSDLKITTNKFDIAEGTSNAKINCDLKNHKYSLWLALVKVNSDIMATNLINLSKEIDGKASGLIEIDTDDSLKLNGKIQFRVYNGIIGKIGLVEYAMKVASLFRNPLTMVSPSVVSDLVSIPEGRFDQIDGTLILKDNVVQPMMIKSTAKQLSSYIIGTYNLEKQDASLRIYTKFSNRKKGVYGFLRNISLNSIANRMPLSSQNDSYYYESEISQIPPIEADEKDTQIFLTKVDGDVEHNNFLSSLKKLK